jgi:hypothetical protein
LFIFWKIHETLLFSNLPSLKTFKHIEAHFPQVVEAKVEPRLSNLTNATIEISPKGFTLTIKAKLKNKSTIFWPLDDPMGRKNTYQLGKTNVQPLGANFVKSNA